jgi:hypothetical protein
VFQLAKLCFVTTLAALLGGCLTAAPHSMAISDFQKYKIVDVRVEGAELIKSWPAQEEIYVKTNAVDADLASRLQTEPAYKFPALRAHIERALHERLKLEFASQINPLFTGSRPVRAIVRFRNFDVPSAARRVFIDQDAKIKADIDLVDANTGASVLSYEGPFRGRRLVGGLATPIALAFDQSDTGFSMLTEYITTYRNWLLKS